MTSGITMTMKPPSFDEDSPAVQKHVDILQGIISRMAWGSRSSKTWCITVVAAILVVVTGNHAPGYAAVWLALAPTVMFCLMDAYYLGLEKHFRKEYDAFLEKLRRKELAADDLYAVKSDGSVFCHIRAGIGSLSVWPFYALIVVMAASVAYLATPSVIPVEPCDKSSLI